MSKVRERWRVMEWGGGLSTLRKEYSRLDLWQVICCAQEMTRLIEMSPTHSSFEDAEALHYLLAFEEEQLDVTHLAEDKWLDMRFGLPPSEILVGNGSVSQSKLLSVVRMATDARWRTFDSMVANRLSVVHRSLQVSAEWGHPEGVILRNGSEGVELPIYIMYLADKACSWVREVTIWLKFRMHFPASEIAISVREARKLSVGGWVPLPRSDMSWKIVEKNESVDELIKQLFNGTTVRERYLSYYGFEKAAFPKDLWFVK